MTAMQLMIQALELTVNMRFPEELRKKFIEKEKQQIIDAYNEGCVEGKIECGDEYFNQTYSQQK
jgi:hypothetical protein